MALLGLDVGTTYCKGAVFSESGKCLGRAERGYDTLRVQPGWAELDASRVVEAAFSILRQLNVAAAEKGDRVSALAIGALGEAMIPVSGGRQVIGNALLHTDMRGQAELDEFMAGISVSELYAINPNIASPSYSLPKLLWRRKHTPELYATTDRFLFFSDLILYLLGCEPLTSFSQANRTLLFDLDREGWSNRLLAMAGIDPGMLPQPVATGTLAGRVSTHGATISGLAAGVRCYVGAHDQCCNALGAGVSAAGKAVDGIGTVECVTPVFADRPHREAMRAAGLHIEHHAVPGLYVTFIYNQAGSLVEWFRRTFVPDLAGDSRKDLYSRLTAEMPMDPTGLLILPHFEGTGAPDYISSSAGVVVGLKISTTRGEILKALLEGETFYFMEAQSALHGLGIDTSGYMATGGGARSAAWLQIKADILGVPIERPKDLEAGVLGSAMIAAVASGVFRNYEEATAVMVRSDCVFRPDRGRHERYAEKFQSYRQLYPRLKDILAPHENMPGGSFVPRHS